MLGKTEGRRRRDDRGWDGWRALLTQWTWVWASSRSWWWTGRPGVLPSMGWQRVRQNWVTELTHKDNTMSPRVCHGTHPSPPSWLPSCISYVRKGKVLIQCLCVKSLKTKNRIPVRSLRSCPHRPLRHWHYIGFYSVTFKMLQKGKAESSILDRRKTVISHIFRETFEINFTHCFMGFKM